MGCLSDCTVMETKLRWRPEGGDSGYSSGVSRSTHYKLPSRVRAGMQPRVRTLFMAIIEPVWHRQLSAVCPTRMNCSSVTSDTGSVACLPTLWHSTETVMLRIVLSDVYVPAGAGRRNSLLRILQKNIDENTSRSDVADKPRCSVGKL